ncbi:hypothetical protein T492DRAFT_1080786 [Pavlovales sp. CCMP2436]|nr:hypothetical protein T492DRAFT_1080786 [Pavlovales sp. CCMP2436]
MGLRLAALLALCMPHGGGSDQVTPLHRRDAAQTKQQDQSAKRALAAATECTLANISASLSPGSAALRRYVSHVYGVEQDEQLALERDQHFYEQLQCCVDVLFVPLLPAKMRRCNWARDPAGFGSVYRLQNYYMQPRNSVWIYRFAHAGCPHRPTNNNTARVLPPELPPLKNHTEEWVEVTHSFTRHYAEVGLSFLYRAKGSGLWYKLGGESSKVLEVRTHERLYVLSGQNVTSGAWPQVRQWAVSRGLESLLVTHRCEAWGPAYHDEIVQILPPAFVATGNARITPSESRARAQTFQRELCAPYYAGGYWPRLHSCNCCAWGVQEPTWCAQGEGFGVRYSVEGELLGASDVNRQGAPPFLFLGGKFANASNGKANGGQAAAAMRIAERLQRTRGRQQTFAAQKRKGRVRAGGAGAMGTAARGMWRRPKRAPQSKRLDPLPPTPRNRRSLQKDISDIVRFPEKFTSTPKAKPVEKDTLHFLHMHCAQAGSPSPSQIVTSGARPLG